MEIINVDEYWRVSAAQWLAREDYWKKSQIYWEERGNAVRANISETRANYAKRMAAWASSHGQLPLPEEMA